MALRDNWGAGGSVYEDDDLDFILHPEAILEAVKRSKDNGTAIGIYSLALGKAMVVTGVEEVVEEGDDIVIVLKKYDMSGHMLNRHLLHLREIISVCPFTSPIKNPFLENLEKDSDWFSIINSLQDSAESDKDLSE
jgi:hypothetical protein